MIIYANVLFLIIIIFPRWVQTICRWECGRGLAPTHTAVPGLDGATSPVSLYQSAFGMTRSLAKVRGPKPAICPKPQGHVGPCRSRWTLRGSSAEAEGDIPTLAALGHNSCKLRVEVYSEKAQHQAVATADSKTGSGDVLLCLFTRLERSRRSFTSAACHFEQLPLWAHSLLDIQNKTHSPLQKKSLSTGFIEMYGPIPSWQRSQLPSRIRHQDRCWTERKKQQQQQHRNNEGWVLVGEDSERQLGTAAVTVWRAPPPASSGSWALQFCSHCRCPWLSPFKPALRKWWVLKVTAFTCRA